MMFINCFGGVDKGVAFDAMRLSNREVQSLIPGQYNFVGKLLGPKGSTLKQLQLDTGTRMSILGRNSIRDKAKEEEQRNTGGPKYSHLHKDLHVLIEAFCPAAEAYSRIGHALTEMKKYFTPDPNDDIRQNQMMEMGMGAPAPRGGGGGCGKRAEAVLPEVWPDHSVPREDDQFLVPEGQGEVVLVDAVLQQEEAEWLLDHYPTQWKKNIMMMDMERPMGMKKPMENPILKEQLMRVATVTVMVVPVMVTRAMIMAARWQHTEWRLWRSVWQLIWKLWRILVWWVWWSSGAAGSGRQSMKTPTQYTQKPASRPHPYTRY
ncbi:putative KH domain-containing, RNA-binding, signal transduction-associated protein 3-like [Apostichopus japonicus]|uniref:Putative KH domain-containing, RNA-binding, signal transduction-associated protein 3-like n=1 Tax=Stichopus japonicus TaxID=307972 RepID=A0A2G8JVS8_STIJA|nr:putative KH domain-containing, RNA-binding, signal transduction-associated protein 3-like [Apostichopus japonicus]